MNGKYDGIADALDAASDNELTEELERRGYVIAEHWRGITDTGADLILEGMAAILEADEDSRWQTVLKAARADKGLAPYVAQGLDFVRRVQRIIR